MTRHVHRSLQSALWFPLLLFLFPYLSFFLFLLIYLNRTTYALFLPFSLPSSFYPFPFFHLSIQLSTSTTLLIPLYLPFLSFPPLSFFPFTYPFPLSPSLLSFSQFLFSTPIIILTPCYCPFLFFPPSRFSPLTFVFLRPVSLVFFIFSDCLSRLYYLYSLPLSFFSLSSLLFSRLYPPPSLLHPTPLLIPFCYIYQLHC